MVAARASSRHCELFHPPHKSEIANAATVKDEARNVAASVARETDRADRTGEGVAYTRFENGWLLFQSYKRKLTVLQRNSIDGIDKGENKAC
jgi:hypothetical protein